MLWWKCSAKIRSIFMSGISASIPTRPPTRPRGFQYSPSKHLPELRRRQCWNSARIDLDLLAACSLQLLQQPLLGHGDVVAGGVFHRVHHLIRLADDLVRALGVVGIRGQSERGADVQV